MSGDELRKLRVIREVIDGKLTQMEAAGNLGLSVRQIRRLAKKVRSQGDSGVIHALAGKTGNRALKAETRERVMSLWINKYKEAGLNFTHFTEKLVEVEKVQVGRESVRKLLRSLGLADHRKVKKPRRHRSRRERRPRFGELLQQDTSPHDWLGTGEVYHLIAVIDDASSRVLHAELFDSDGTLNNLSVMKTVFTEHGLPMGVYTDKAAWFHAVHRKQRKPFDPDAEIKLRPLTQIGRALKRLGVELIAAHSPQAKGRIERLNGTLQDRLIAEFKLNRIRDRASANRFIREVFLPEHNRRFAVAPTEAESAFLPLVSPRILDEILCLEFTSQVQNDNTTSFRRWYRIQCKATAQRAHWAKARVRVRIWPGGKVQVHHAETQAAIPFEILSLNLPQESKGGDPMLADGEDISKWQKSSKSGHF